MTGPRGCTVLFGALLFLIGLAGISLVPIRAAGFPGIPALILGVVVVVAAISEPLYGQLVRRPLSGGWRPTGEKFMDPTSGKPVEVWFDPKTGERRYVDIEGEEQR